MFTGIVESLAKVIKVAKDDDFVQLLLEFPEEISSNSLGDSICINGVCLTVARISDRSLIGFDVIEETLNKTNISSLKINDLVNVERSMSVGGRIEGHILQGHVEGVAKIVEKKQKGTNLRMSLEVPNGLIKYCVEKGSISLDGVSLTIASIKNNFVEVALIPYTLEKTTLGIKGISETLNVETDILGKYIYNMMQKYEKI